MSGKEYEMSSESVKIADCVRLKKDTLFWKIGEEGELICRSGSEYPVVDIVQNEGFPKGVILENYDPVTKENWVAAVELDEVELTWKMPR